MCVSNQLLVVSSERIKPGCLVVSSFIKICISVTAVSPQESKKHLAGLGSLGLGSLITEITANEGEDKEENRDTASVDAEGESKYTMELCFDVTRNRTKNQFQCIASFRLGEKH